MFAYTTLTLVFEALCLYTSTATFNHCYSELMSYTVLANSYGVSVYDMYQLQGHAH